MGEFNLYGIYVPTLLIQSVIAYALLCLLIRLLNRWVERGWIGQPNLFYLCMYLVLLWLVHWGFIVCV